MDTDIVLSSVIGALGPVHLQWTSAYLSTNWKRMRNENTGTEQAVWNNKKP